MTHRIEVNATTGETKMVEYTADEQAAHDAAVAQADATIQPSNETQEETL
jgi:hypothetical protein